MLFQSYTTAMSLSDYNWSTILASDSLLPPDVTFLVTEGETLERFPGHRVLLGLISSVFEVDTSPRMKCNLCHA